MDQIKNYETIKIITLGSYNVGKTTLLMRYKQGYFTQQLYNCMGIEFFHKMVQRFGKNYRLQIWDQSGSGQFINLSNSYFRFSNCITLVYDIKNRQSFENLKKYYTQAQTVRTQTNTVYILIGNKSDNEGQRQVSFREGEELAKSYGFIFLETSAKTGYNVDNMYDLILDEYLQVG